MSTLESKKTILKKEEFLIDEQIRQVFISLENIWIEKNLNIDFNLINTSYFGNENLLFQVWQNLFVNAIKFSKDNGYIYVKLDKSKDFVIISIEDSGIGLTLTKKIVELHNGKIDVISKLNKGSTFIVYLILNIKEEKTR